MFNTLPYLPSYKRTPNVIHTQGSCLEAWKWTLWWNRITIFKWMPIQIFPFWTQIHSKPVWPSPPLLLGFWENNCDIYPEVDGAKRSFLLQKKFNGANLIMCWLSWQQRANMHCMHVNYEIHIFAMCIREYCDWWGLEFGESWWCIWIFLNWRITASASTSCISCLFWSRSSNRCRGAGSALEQSLFDCISFFWHPAIL